MVARGADYRVRWCEQLRPTHSLTDLEESALSCDEDDSYDSLTIDEQRSHSQGVDNSSEGDRSSEAADPIAAAAGGRKQRSSYAHAHSIPELEELTGKRGSRRVLSLTDLRHSASVFVSADRSSRQSANAPLGVGVGRASDAMSAAADSTTHAVLRHHRRHSRQQSAQNWQHIESVRYSAYSQRFRKKNSIARSEAFAFGFGSSRHSTQSEGCASPAVFTIPDDVPSLLRAIEERDRQIASACHEKARLLEEYYKLLSRSHSCERARDSVRCSSVEQSASSATHFSQSQSQEAEMQVRVNLELLKNIISAGDGAGKLSELQRIDILLALNNQFSNLLVCFVFKSHLALQITRIYIYIYVIYIFTLQNLYIRVLLLYNYISIPYRY